MASTFKTRKSQETFERVLQAAASLFQERGYEATTLRDISAASRLGLGALYYYFSSKEDVVLAFYDRIQAEVAEKFARQPRVGDMAENFRNLMLLKLEALAPHRDLLRVILKEAVDPHSPLCPLHSAASGALHNSLQLFGQIAGPSGLARGLWALHMGLLGYFLHDPSQGSRSTYLLLDTVTGLLKWSDRLARIPGLGGLRNQLLARVDDLFERKATSL